jgi:hypothetical protein
MNTIELSSFFSLPLTSMTAQDRCCWEHAFSSAFSLIECPRECGGRCARLGYAGVLERREAAEGPVVARHRSSGLVPRCWGGGRRRGGAEEGAGHVPAGAGSSSSSWVERAARSEIGEARGEGDEFLRCIGVAAALEACGRRHQQLQQQWRAEDALGIPSESQLLMRASLFVFVLLLSICIAAASVEETARRRSWRGSTGLKL